MTEPVRPAADPRTLVLDLSTRFGGSDARVLGLMAGMPAGSATVAVLRGAPIEAAARDLGIPVRPIASHKADPRILVRLRRLLHVGRFDVLDTQNPQSRLWGSIATRGTRVALVSTLNSWYEAEHEGRLKGRLYQALERFTPAPASYIAVSPDIRDRLLAQGVEADSVALIPNAVEAGPGTGAIAGNAAGLRERFGFPADAVVAIAVGRLVEAKGYDVLVDAAGRLAECHPTLRTIIVGEGHLRPLLEERIASLGLTGRVVLAGFQAPSDVPGMVASADLFIMPSRTEGTPLALLEAAALERPIVASAVGGIPDLVRDEEEAVLVVPGDSEVLASAIDRLVEDPQRARGLGSAAGRRIAREFSRTRQVEDTVAVYRLAVERHRRRQRLSRF